MHSYFIHTLTAISMHIWFVLCCQ